MGKLQADTLALSCLFCVCALGFQSFGIQT